MAATQVVEVLFPDLILCVGGDVDIVAGITKLGEQVVGNTKLE